MPTLNPWVKSLELSPEVVSWLAATDTAIVPKGTTMPKTALATGVIGAIVSTLLFINVSFLAGMIGVGVTVLLVVIFLGACSGGFGDFDFGGGDGGSDGGFGGND